MSVTFYNHQLQSVNNPDEEEVVIQHILGLIDRTEELSDDEKARFRILFGRLCVPPPCDTHCEDPFLGDEEREELAALLKKSSSQHLVRWERYSQAFPSGSQRHYSVFQHPQDALHAVKKSIAVHGKQLKDNGVTGYSIGRVTKDKCNHETGGIGVQFVVDFSQPMEKKNGYNDKSSRNRFPIPILYRTPYRIGGFPCGQVRHPDDTENFEISSLNFDLL